MYLDSEDGWGLRIALGAVAALSCLGLAGTWLREYLVTDPSAAVSVQYLETTASVWKVICGFVAVVTLGAAALVFLGGAVLGAMQPAGRWVFYPAMIAMGVNSALGLNLFVSVALFVGGFVLTWLILFHKPRSLVALLCIGIAIGSAGWTFDRLGQPLVVQELVGLDSGDYVRLVRDAHVLLSSSALIAERPGGDVPPADVWHALSTPRSTKIRLAMLPRDLADTLVPLRVRARVLSEADYLVHIERYETNAPSAYWKRTTSSGVSENVRPVRFRAWRVTIVDLKRTVITRKELVGTVKYFSPVVSSRTEGEAELKRMEWEHKNAQEPFEEFAEWLRRSSVVSG